MKCVSVTDAEQGLASLLDAAQREPIMIRLQETDVAVLLSVQEYERLRVFNVAEFQRFCDRIGARAAKRGLTESKLEKLLENEG